MSDILRRSLSTAVWIPLRAHMTEYTGPRGAVGSREETFAAGSVAVRVNKMTEADELGWHDIGSNEPHTNGFNGKRYIPSDVMEDMRAGRMVPLVLEQITNRGERNVWHLHQDFVIALDLLREGDDWLAANEGYVKVARLLRKADSAPSRLEVRAEHLRDYLCARRMALYVSTYRDRQKYRRNVLMSLGRKSPIARRSVTNFAGRAESERYIRAARISAQERGSSRLQGRMWISASTFQKFNSTTPRSGSSRGLKRRWAKSFTTFEGNSGATNRCFRRI
jgi:hypothetical protein